MLNKIRYHYLTIHQNKKTFYNIARKIDVDAADSINGVKVDWEVIVGLDLLKARNEKHDALDIIITTFFVFDERKIVAVSDLVEEEVFRYLDAEFNDVKASISSV